MTCVCISIILLFRVHGELQQLRNGLLGTLHLEHLCEAHPNLLWSLLVADKKRLTAASFQEMFLVCYSAQGSNDRMAEEAIVMSFYDYLQDCEGEKCIIICQLA